MATEKNLLSTKRFFNASPVDAFVNLELTGEKSFIKPDKTDNVVDLAQKFGEERNACMKFCIYGMIQSKWSDSDSVKIDFYIADSSTNINATDQQNLFWVYDKSTNVTATTWSVASRPLDNVSGTVMSASMPRVFRLSNCRNNSWAVKSANSCCSLARST